MRNPKNNPDQQTSLKSESKKAHAWLSSKSVSATLPSLVPHILVVDDEEGICQLLAQLLTESGYAVWTCTQAHEALEELEKEHIDLVLTDVRLPGMSGVELTKRIVERWPGVSIIVMTGFSEIDIAVEVLKLGASDFIRKPFSSAGIQEAIKMVLEQSRVLVDIRHLRNDLKERCQFGGMLSRTSEMLRVFETIRMVAETDATVVIEGETGTGKDLVAKAIHHQSMRKGGPFIAINCAGVPETLLESELFGYERGAFTGADRARPGKIELAHGGTLFLDEIESMPLTMQAKLLLVLETQTVQRLGSNRSAQIDMRVVAATNIPLKELRAKGAMRTDFYYRLNVVLIPLLPLRKRTEDIPLLVHDYLRHHPIAIRKNITQITTEAMNRLMSYNWPGNVRELQNVLEKALVLCRSRLIENVELPDASLVTGRTQNTASLQVPFTEDAPLDEWVKNQERAYLIQRLEAFSGRIGPTAKSCGVDVRTIHRKMRLYGLDKKDFSGNRELRHSDPKSVSRDRMNSRLTR
jgi:DNA-binding NtrC family response regulator